MTTGPDTYPPELAVGVTGRRITGVSAPARVVHKAILHGFASTGHAPEPAILAAAMPADHDVGMVLAELHDHDVIRLDQRGRIRAAYPFSGVATVHTVTIAGGPRVYAMCAIDALGVADITCVLSCRSARSCRGAGVSPARVLVLRSPAEPPRVDLDAVVQTSARVGAMHQHGFGGDTIG